MCDLRWSDKKGRGRPPEKMRGNRVWGWRNNRVAKPMYCIQFVLAGWPINRQGQGEEYEKKHKTSTEMMMMMSHYCICIHRTNSCHIRDQPHNFLKCFYRIMMYSVNRKVSVFTRTHTLFLFYFFMVCRNMLEIMSAGNSISGFKNYKIFLSTDHIFLSLTQMCGTICYTLLAAWMADTRNGMPCITCSALTLWLGNTNQIPV